MNLTSESFVQFTGCNAEAAAISRSRETIGLKVFGKVPGKEDIKRYIEEEKQKNSLVC
ncbi:hypothetical protein [Desulfofundulus sp.]|uniref:hypothetical protein n=1 Tax=Desulfofundulus sp. TaxID=2282750 RepID=UPI003C770559